MTYNAPELVLVGTAQNVVLNEAASLDPLCLVDPLPDSYDPQLW